MITNCGCGQSAPGPGDSGLTTWQGGLAERLAAAQRELAAAVEGDVRERFQRRLTAICDAMKTSGADEARCTRRLELLLADLSLSLRVSEQR